LTQDLGRTVEPQWPRKLDANARREIQVRSLVDHGTLEASIRVPNAVAPIDLAADLRGRLLRTSVALPAPKEGRPRTRITWLLRQMADAPDGLLVEARYPNQKEPSGSSLKDAKVKPERLLYALDQKRDPMAFRLTMSKELGAKRGRGAGSFVLESKQQTSDFYRAVVQGQRAWTASAPKLPEAISAPAEATPEPPPFSAPDREFGEATEPPE
jgi:hypothetical protein